MGLSHMAAGTLSLTFATVLSAESLMDPRCTSASGITSSSYTGKTDSTDLQMSPLKDPCLSQTDYIAYRIRHRQDEFSPLADVINVYIVECLELLLDSSSRIKLPPFIQVSGFRVDFFLFFSD